MMTGLSRVKQMVYFQQDFDQIFPNIHIQMYIHVQKNVYTCM